jgi:hypothetical protein
LPSTILMAVQNWNWGWCQGRYRWEMKENNNNNKYPFVLWLQKTFPLFLCPERPEKLNSFCWCLLLQNYE